jgi:hypothetical protein
VLRTSNSCLLHEVMRGGQKVWTRLWAVDRLVTDSKSPLFAMSRISTCKHALCGKMTAREVTAGLPNYMVNLIPRLRATLMAAVAVASWSMLVLPQAALADNPFSPGSADYKIVGAVPGDQMFSQLSLSTNGGYLVWQDSVADGDGFAIVAQRLSSFLAAVGPKFRVNSVGTGQQENPQVVQLNNGGAAFFWQGGKVGFQKIYGRFLGSIGTNFLSTDILVNSYTNESQTCPSAARLADGNVIVVWASQGQGGSYQGVFGQLLSPVGAKIGAEFGISQSTGYNHRAPAVAALSGGGFVVAWITELQRTSSSIDAVARVFDAMGSPTGSVLLLNNTNAGICANPSVVGRSDGGFTVAWSQKSAVVYNSVITRGGSAGVDGWDVQVASFGTNGAVKFSPKRVNTVTSGDQYAPKLAAFGADSLIIWNSFAQDGSWEGVYGQFLEQQGTFAGVEFPINTVKVSRQLSPCISTDGVSRFLVCWSSFGAGVESFELWGRNYDLIRIDITPVSGGVQISWNSYPGASYQVQQSSNQSTWSNLQTVSQVSGYRTAVNVPFQGGPAFYRVIRTN